MLVECSMFRSMRRSEIVCLALVLFVAGSSFAQVVSPAEIKDPELRALQQQYLDDLKLAERQIAATSFDYPFYLSRKLDLDQAQQAQGDQRAVRFDKYEGKTVIAITGKYSASYSSEKMNPEQRARSTFLNVVLRVLQGTVPRFQSNPHVEGYTVEVSQHVLGRAMVAAMGRPETLLVFLPQSAAITLLTLIDEDARQAALQQGQIFLNAVPVSVWLNGTGPQSAANVPSGNSGDGQSSAPRAGVQIDRKDREAYQPPETTASPTSLPKPKAPPSPPHDISPEALSSLQTANQPLLDQIVKEMDPQAHFVAYAPPKFAAFRDAVYLDLSMNSDLPASAAGSRYKQAALAFDDHIARLIRPLLAYFKGEQKFDGIGFTTTVHLAVTPAPTTSEGLEVEFFLPLSSLRCYEKYDCTGQQLLDAGTVLINGERVTLDLQIAEGAPRH
jgi:hypothetical protein